MPFYEKNDKIITTKCAKCTCAEDENDKDCQCLCDTPDAPTDSGGPHSGTAKQLAPGSSLPPYVERCHPCIYFAHYLVKCPVRSGKDCECITPYCYSFDAAVRKGQGLKVKDYCECPKDENGDSTGSDDAEEDCIKPNQGGEGGEGGEGETPPADGSLGSTSCGGSVYKISPDFCSQAELDEWKESHLPKEDDKKCCIPTGYFIGVRKAKDEENNDDPCALDTPKSCCDFETSVYDGKICPGTVCGVAVECMNAGGSIDDPDTGDTIHIHQISPGNLCGQDYADWYEEASQPGGEIEKKKKELCDSRSTSVSYELEEECWIDAYDQDSPEKQHSGSCTSASRLYHTESAGDLWIKTWTKYTLRRTDSTPSDATGVVFCRITYKTTEVYSSCPDFCFDSCSTNDKKEKTKDKFTLKFNDTFEARADDAPVCHCTCIGDECGEGEHDCETRNTLSIDLYALQYSYD